MGVLGQFGLGRALTLREIPGPGRNRKTTQFPGPRGRETAKKSYHAIRDGCLQFFYILRFGQPDPQGRETRNTGILGHFGPGRPSALGEIPGAGRKQKNTICWP